MTMENRKAQVILNWLKDPTTKRYIKQLLQDEQTFEKLAVITMKEAVNGGFKERTQDEMRTFAKLNSIQYLLSMLPHQILQKSENEEELKEEDLKVLEEFFEQLPN